MSKKKDTKTLPLPFGFKTQPAITIKAENGGGHRNQVDQTIWTVYSLLPDYNTPYERDLELHRLRTWIKDSLDTSDIDFRTFYQSNNAKITRPLKTILEATLGKTVVALKFADFCREIGTLYSSFTCEAKFIKPYFTEREPTADYGDAGSCFRPGGCNEQNGRMIDGSPCMSILTITPMDTEKYARGRMVIQVLDDTHVLLTNRYSEYNKIEIPTNIYVRALEAFCNAEITFKKEHHPEETNIFYNNTPWIGRCTEGNFDNLTLDYRIICSVCGTLFVPSDGFTDSDGPCVHCCSEECRDEAAENRYECFECGARLHEDDMFYVEDEHYCEGCYNEYCFRCEHCDEYFRQQYSRMAYQVGHHGRMMEVTVCEYCADNHYSVCEECGELVDSGNMNEVEDDWYCPACVEQVTNDCEECGERFHEDHLNTKGYCDECVNKIEAEKAA